MATISVKFRPSVVLGGAGSVYYKVSHRKEVRYVTTDYKLLSTEWDEERGCVIVDQTNAQRREACEFTSRRINRDVRRLRRVIENLVASGSEFGSADVVAMFLRQQRQNMLGNYMEGLAARLRLLGRAGTAANYVCALRSFLRFRNDDDMALDDIDADVMEHYEAWLRLNGCAPNTTSFYLRILRAAYRRAVEEGMVMDNKPFRKVYTGVEKTRKRAIGIDDIRRIKSLDLRNRPRLEFVRDVFLLQFYAMGMSFVDLAHLRKSNMKGKFITYRRRKTGQAILVPIHAYMEEIIKRYSRRDTSYLLPIIRHGTDTQKQYEAALRRVNNSLKTIAKLAEISAPLTTYVSRHTWASSAKRKGVPIATISDALGHDSVQTTEIYLSQISTEELENANNLILNDL